MNETMIFFWESRAASVWSNASVWKKFKKNERSIKLLNQLIDAMKSFRCEYHFDCSQLKCADWNKIVSALDWFVSSFFSTRLSLSVKRYKERYWEERAHVHVRMEKEEEVNERCFWLKKKRRANVIVRWVCHHNNNNNKHAHERTIYTNGSKRTVTCVKCIDWEMNPPKMEMAKNYIGKNQKLYECDKKAVAIASCHCHFAIQLYRVY